MMIEDYIFKNSFSYNYSYDYVGTGTYDIIAYSQNISPNATQKINVLTGDRFFYIFNCKIEFI